jgi:tetratricopeptide (TPR) repeat protein
MLLTMATAAFCDTADEFFKSGAAKQASGDLDGAIADYTKAIELKPNLEGAYVNRGNAKQAKGDIDGAITDYNAAIELKPGDPLAYYNRGIGKRAKGDLDGAVADYNKAIELKPDYAYAYNNRGAAKQAKGDLDGAIADYTKAIELVPDYALAYSERGAARQAKGDPGAKGDFAKATQLRPELAVAALTDAEIDEAIQRGLHRQKDLYAHIAGQKIVIKGRVTVGGNKAIILGGNKATTIHVLSASDRIGLYAASAAYFAKKAKQAPAFSVRDARAMGLGLVAVVLIAHDFSRAQTLAYKYDMAFKVDGKVIRWVSPGAAEGKWLAGRLLFLGCCGTDVSSTVFMFPAIEGAQKVTIVVTTGASNRIEKEVDAKWFALQ